MNKIQQVCKKQQLVMEVKMAEKKYLTPEGKKQLEEKLDYLKSVKRPEVVKKIGIAREYGDLSENAEYDSAKEEQAALEAEIAEIEDLLLYAIVINKKNIDTSVVSVGTKVALYDEEFDEDVSYTITGSSESDPKNGFISNESPVGKALIGHKVGDKVAVTTPGGEIFYTIKKISV